MRPHAYYQIDQDDLILFDQIRRAIEAMKDLEPGAETDTPLLSCHILAMAVAQVFGGLTVIHGRYLGFQKGLTFFDHTWLSTLHRNIIDVYPIGHASGPILIDGSMTMINSRIYVAFDEREGERLYSSLIDTPHFRVALTETVAHLHAALSTL